MSQDLESRVRSFLGARQCISLATDGPGGLWAAAVMYAPDGYDLYIFSRPDSRHGRNIGNEARVAGTINEDDSTWPTLQGIQLEGACTLLTEPGAKLRAFALFVERFPGVKQMYGGGDDLQAMLDSDPGHQMYRLRPDHLAFLDHTVSYERQTLF